NVTSTLVGSSNMRLNSALYSGVVFGTGGRGACAHAAWQAPSSRHRPAIQLTPPRGCTTNPLAPNAKTSRPRRFLRQVIAVVVPLRANLCPPSTAGNSTAHLKRQAVPLLRNQRAGPCGRGFRRQFIHARIVMARIVMEQHQHFRV